MRRTVLAAALCLAALATTGGAHAAAGPNTLLDAIRGEADWILALRDGTGAIASRPAKDLVVPYQANLAAEGLARAFSLTHNVNYSTAAWRWLEWYRDHQNQRDGTITNYVRSSGGAWVSNGALDSTDAYAGTYLSAAREVFMATGDLTRLVGIKSALSLAISAIELTQDDDGLHTAKPGWPFKYTMDESEAYAGLRAAENLFLLLGDTANSERAGTRADNLLAGSAKLIDPSTGWYLWALHTDGTRVPAPIAWIYPGASAQAWAVAYGLSTGAAARNLLNQVDAMQPDWRSPNATTEYYPGFCANPVPPDPPPCHAKVGFWVRFSLAHLALGDISDARDSALSIRAAAVGGGRPFPFTCADAGLIVTVLSDPKVLASTTGVPV